MVSRLPRAVSGVVDPCDVCQRQDHRPSGVAAATVLPNGVKITAGIDGEVNAYNPNNLIQFSARIPIMQNGAERITMLCVAHARD